VRDVATGRERSGVVRGTWSFVRLRYSFTSILLPETAYRCDLASGTSTALRRPRPPFDPADYETRRVFYASTKGTRVPMFIIARLHVRLP
jgi:prolyl oligopeptidase